MRQSYFESLELAFQSLTNQVQRALATEVQKDLQETKVVEPYDDGYYYDYSDELDEFDDDDDVMTSEGSFIGDNNSLDLSEQTLIPTTTSETPVAVVVVTLPKLFTRCRAIFQQMYFEAKKDPEYQDRLDLYRIQLQTLTKHFKEMEEERNTSQLQQEVTFTFLDEIDEELDEEDWL